VVTPLECHRLIFYRALCMRHEPYHIAGFRDKGAASSTAFSPERAAGEAPARTLAVSLLL
jgi:hypothetical protein